MTRKRRVGVNMSMGISTQRFLLALSAVALGAVIMIALFKTNIPRQNQRIADLATGVILGWGGTVFGFYFGTSQSSADKNEVIAAMSVTPGTVTIDQPANQPVPVTEAPTPKAPEIGRGGK